MSCWIWSDRRWNKFVLQKLKKTCIFQQELVLSKQIKSFFTWALTWSLDVNEEIQNKQVTFPAGGFPHDSHGNPVAGKSCPSLPWAWQEDLVLNPNLRLKINNSFETGPLPSVQEPNTSSKAHTDFLCYFSWTNVDSKNWAWQITHNIYCLKCLNSHTFSNLWQNLYKLQLC